MFLKLNNLNENVTHFSGGNPLFLRGLRPPPKEPLRFHQYPSRLKFCIIVIGLKKKF